MEWIEKWSIYKVVTIENDKHVLWNMYCDIKNALEDENFALTNTYIVI